MECIKKVGDFGHSDHDLYFIQPLFNFVRATDEGISPINNILIKKSLGYISWRAYHSQAWRLL